MVVIVTLIGAIERVTTLIASIIRKDRILLEHIDHLNDPAISTPGRPAGHHRHVLLALRLIGDDAAVVALAVVVPSEELRSFPFGCTRHGARRILSHQGLGDRLIRSGAIVATDGLISRRRRLGGMLRFYYRGAANVIARIVGQNAFQSQSQRFIAIT